MPVSVLQVQRPPLPFADTEELPVNCRPVYSIYLQYIARPAIFPIRLMADMSIVCQKWRPKITICSVNYSSEKKLDIIYIVLMLFAPDDNDATIRCTKGRLKAATTMAAALLATGKQSFFG